MALSAEQFLSQLHSSGLMSPKDTSAFMEGLPAASRPQDAQQLARLLVQQHVLTAFQAKQVVAGKAKALLLGNYVILDLLGHGGMGMVLKARHRKMDRIVALKILSPKLTKSPDLLARFQREVKVVAKLEHPHIVTAHDADEANGTHFLVMQYVPGSDLASVVKRNGLFTIDQAVSCVLQAAQGLEYAHRQGVIHRDVKPANLLLDSRGTVKLLDMGLARLNGNPTNEAATALTESGNLLGTVDYMAPEQALDSRQADAQRHLQSGMRTAYAADRSCDLSGGYTDQKGHGAS